MSQRRPVQPDRVLFAGTDETLREVQWILRRIEPDGDFRRVEEAFHDTVLLFDGRYPGYRASRTAYHDLGHTLGVFLATARLLHGALLSGLAVEPEAVTLGLIGALFHDTGLIQTDGDHQGTGAKYTIGHEQRSIAFMRRYLAERGFRRRQQEDCAHIIGCTVLSLPPERLPFRTEQIGRVGRIVGTADLLAQMADRLYLEKLLYLYREFREAGLPGYESELDLLEKSDDFYRHITRHRLPVDLGGMNRLARAHFRERLGQDRDLYEEGLEKNIAYLRKILQECREDYRQMLRRAGIVASLG